MTVAAASFDSGAHAARVIEQTDYFRRSSRRLGGAGPHKEWQHFIVHADALHLLINFNLLDDALRPAATETGRVIVLARTGAGWTGGVATTAPDALVVNAGSIDAQFGEGELSFDGRDYRVRVELREPRITADLRFTPTTIPALCPNQPLSRTESLSWLFVPRLTASGFVEVGGERVVLNNAAAYHDHNWGVFRWGDDFTWEWSSVLPESSSSPWSAVYMRLMDRGRSVARCQGLYVWHGESHRKIFRDHDLTVSMSGSFQGRDCLKIPRVMALLAPGIANDVPQRMTIRARDGVDDVTLTFDLADLCQVIVPNERDLQAVVTLNEATGRARLEGRLGDESMSMEGPGVFEFIR
jgi:hypothetical protein